MRCILFFVFLLTGFANIYAQQDSILVEAKVLPDLKSWVIKQEIVFHNRLSNPVSKIKLLNWGAAYRNRNTTLLHRRLEDRKNDLYFAPEQDLAQISGTQIWLNQQLSSPIDEDAENIYIDLSEPLQPGQSVALTLHYNLKLPNAKFTGYGISADKIAVKYLFLVPDGFETDDLRPRFFMGIEENQTSKTFWDVKLDTPANLYSKSNLPEVSAHHFVGNLNNDPEFLLSYLSYPSIKTSVDNRPVLIDFGYDLSENERQNLEFFLPLHLKFIERKSGLLPEKIYISAKFKKEEDFFGNDDLKFWKFHYPLFKESENTDLDYFGILAKNVLNQSLIFDRNQDHWLINGLKTYFEIQYLQQFYSGRLLLGDLPDEFKIFGLKPLKLFHASELTLLERYGLAYQYIMSDNFDQAIAEPYSKLSNFNRTAISNFETGTLFNFISEKTGEDTFDAFVIQYIADYQGKTVNKTEFLDRMSEVSKGSSTFIETFIGKKQRLNFNLKSFKRNGDDFALTVSKNDQTPAPFKINTEEQSGDVKTFLFDTPEKEGSETYAVDHSEAEKIILNGGYSFPESNYRDNYLYTKGVFANTKKIKFKLIRDIPNPEFNEIYLNPRVTFNAYDAILLGLNFKNSSLFRQKFSYSLTPYYSTGTQRLTGSGGVSYSFMPPESFFRVLQVGVSGSYFHYDYDLKYRKFSTYAAFSFTKNPRSDINRSLGISYNYFERDLSPQMIAENEYAKYNLWNFNYNYFDQRIIHENYIGTGLQLMEDFQKVTADVFYRYEFAQNKKISFRLFAGYFLTNHTKNNLFNFGISRVSNYAFSYGLIGQSATSGILSQQIILAEGGFKSFVATSANQWLGSLNIDSHVWKWFNVYADAGIFKNKYQDPQFIWDSGVKLKVIPDFLELYFPIQSSLGFEPAFKDYAKRIRFTLVLNLGAVTSYFRRGVF